MSYTNSEIKNLRAKVFSYTNQSGGHQVKAFLKKNALRKLREYYPGLVESDIRQISAINSHQAPVDEITEVAEGEYEIQYIQAYE